MKLTASQRKAIEHRGSNLLVSASAGSGKTEVLARRCVSLIADPRQPCDVDRLLVVTFTRAAAAELRVRVGRMLREEAARTKEGKRRAHLRRQEVLVETADIGTIDAWCGRLVREFAVAAGVDPEFTVLGAQDALLLRRRVLDTLLERIHRGDGPGAEAGRAWLVRATSPDDGFLRVLVGCLNRFREHLVNPQVWFAEQAERCAASDAEDVLATALLEECRFQHEQLAALSDAEPAEIAEALRTYREQLGTWCAALTKAGNVREISAAIGAFKLPKIGERGATEPPVVVEVRDRWLSERLQKRWSAKVLDPILGHAEAVAGLVGTLLQLEGHFHESLSEAKRQQASYEFGDVLRMTLDLLGEPQAGSRREPTPVAGLLQQRYEHVLVDEYQDTSPVQVEILRLVTRARAGCSNRFMVGDVKQSIYGFRQAEPRLFTELIDKIEAGAEEGEVEYLSDNFRSHADLLEALNGMFAQLFDRALGGTPFGPDERLRAGRRETEVENPTLAGAARMEVHVLEQDERGGQRADDDDADVERIEREAQLAAERIGAMLAGGVQVPERRADGSVALRPLRLADVAILLRSAKRNAGLVADVLRANGIACATGGREALLAAVEVRDVRSVLQLLVNRRQDVPLAAYLRSPLGNMTAAELLKVRQATPERGDDFHAAVEHYLRDRPDAEVAGKLAAALAQLDRWADAARDEELPALLRRILDEGGLLMFARGLAGGGQRVTLLRALQGHARQFAAGGRGGVAEFVEYLDALTEEEIEPGAPTAGAEDAVQIMTIHAAKGLEFPIVFLLGTGAQFSTQRQRETLLCDEDVGLGLKFKDYRQRSEVVSARWYVAQRRGAQRELAEELRLLYVATTRARERLFIVGHSPPGAWENRRTLHARGHADPALISRMIVHNALEWVLMGLAASGACDAVEGPPAVQVSVHDAGSIELRSIGAPRPAASARSPKRGDADWIARGWELLANPPDLSASRQPAALSVSVLKEAAVHEADEERPAVLDHVTERLGVPIFASGDVAADGRTLGTACHRFLEFADLRRLESSAQVAAQVTELVGAGRMSADEGKLVPGADVAWLGSSAEGRLLAERAATVQREVPFVYALRSQVTGRDSIVRGVIDCIVPTGEGLVILDYKTDAPRDERELETRLAGYRQQMRIYAQAASSILAQPVARGVLVFLRVRRAIDVPLEHVELDELLRGMPAAYEDGGVDHA